jgi:hypothetical protein
METRKQLKPKIWVSVRSFPGWKKVGSRRRIRIKCHTTIFEEAMPHVDHILVPIDLHDNAGPVVAWQRPWRVFHSTLTLLHVNESLSR